MPKPAPLPEPLPSSGFTVAEARRHGVSRSRMRAGDLSAPFHSVRATAEVSGVQARATAYAARMQRTQFFSHTTAAVLHGLRMPEGFRETDLHVTSMVPTRAPRGAGIAGHQSERATMEMVDGLRVLTAVETWCQVSATLSLDDLVAMGDGLVRRRKPLTTLEGLRLAVSRYSGRGCRRLREAFGLVRAGTDSSRETQLRLLMLRAGFPEPEVNGLILNSHGAEIAHGDLVFRASRTILEYEGRHHSENALQFAIDISRLDELMEEGWRVIRVDRTLMARRATLLDKVDRALRAGS
ncbi:MAG: hypothetical protein JF618_05510 [Leifsonia sp.]|nr:hypothetical protein [Leifsonia sp.]